MDLRQEFLFKEFEKLKDEQTKRIEFRDQMIYLTLGAVGAVFSFVLANERWLDALLVLPFVCIIMGWTYLSNDLKITQINVFLKTVLLAELNKNLTTTPIDITKSWENFITNDKTRFIRKRTQLIVDSFTFLLPGFIAVLSFYVKSCTLIWHQWLIIDVESLSLTYLFVQFYKASK